MAKIKKSKNIVERIVGFDVLDKYGARIFTELTSSDTSKVSRIYIDDASISDEKMGRENITEIYKTLYQNSKSYNEKEKIFILENLEVCLRLPNQYKNKKGNYEDNSNLVLITSDMSEVRKYFEKGIVKYEEPEFCKFSTDELIDIGFENINTYESFNSLKSQIFDEKYCRVNYLKKLLEDQNVSLNFPNKYILLNYLGEQDKKEQILFKTILIDEEINLEIMSDLNNPINYTQLFSENKANKPKLEESMYSSELVEKPKLEEKKKMISPLEEKLLKPVFNIYPNDLGQGILLNDILRNDAIKIGIVSGNGGTGKSILTFLAGLEQTLSLVESTKSDYSDGKHTYNRIIILIHDDYYNKYKDIGELIKNLPYIDHFVEAGFYKKNFSKLFSDEKIGDLNFEFNGKIYLPNPRSPTIELMSHIAVKSRTFKDAYVIVDEVQNYTPREVLFIAKTQGENSKHIFLGDSAQIENSLKNITEDSNGLWQMVNSYGIDPNDELTTYIRLTKDQRSEESKKAADLLKQVKI
jgi:hypothetical protein